MIEVVPAILSSSYEDMKNKLALVRGIVPVVQIDLCDGVFVPSTTWPFLGGGQLDEHFTRIQNGEEGLPFWEDMDFELDLMVADAVENFDVYLKLGPRRMIFHMGAVGDLREFKEFLEGMDVYVKEATEVGVAITVLSPLEDLYPLVPHLDFVQVMGIEKIGFQGQDFTERSLEYIKTLSEKFPDLTIAVDGGVNLETAKKLVEAGATRLAAGSAILKSSDIMGTIEELRNV